jgi:predicted transcriptional regulator
MKYVPYEDAARKKEVISRKHYLGLGTKQIAEEMGISQQEVSYYKAKLGIVRHRDATRNKIPMCVVCHKNPVSDSTPHVCNNKVCLMMFLEVMECEQGITARVGKEQTLTKVDSLTKVAVDIQKHFMYVLPDEAKVCVLFYTKLFPSLAIHIRYHAYHHAPDTYKLKRSPFMLWKDEGEYKLYQMAMKEKEFIRRNKWSEDLQNRRPK